MIEFLQAIDNVWMLVGIGAVFAAGYAYLWWSIETQNRHLMQYTETASTYWDTTIK